MATKPFSGVKNFLKVPFVIGNVMVNPNRPTETDGKISSTVLMACIIPIIFVIIVVSAIEPAIRKPSPASWGITEIIVTVGLFFSLFLSIGTLKSKSKWICGVKARDLSQRPRLAFLWLFGFVIILNSMLEMSINIDCVLKHSREPFPGEQILSAFSHLMEILFFASQLGFIAYFVNYKFFTSICLNYGISIMLITHLVFWFHMNVNSLFRHGILKSQNFTSLNASDCFWGSDINTLRHSIQPYATPAQTEYSLLAAAFLLKIWCTTDEENEEMHNNDQTMEPNERSPLLNHHDESIQQSRNDNTRPANFSRVVVDVPVNSDKQNYEGDNESSDYSTMDDAIQYLRATRRQYPVSFYVIIIIGIALVCPILVSALIMITVRKQYIEMQFAWQILTFIFSFMHVLFTITTFSLTRKQCIKRNIYPKMKSKEYILILSATGTVAHSTFIILSVALNNGSTYFEKQTVNVLIVSEVIDIIGVYIQTVLIIYAGQCLGRSRNNVCVGVSSLYLLLLITNLASWCCHSFVDDQIKGIRKNQFSSYTTNYWPVMHELLYPFVIFYRFHSGMDMYGCYRKFR
ncbi:hypothetical protein FSP39_004452 [Pinctada imbricata]|uniref:Uncharacterized protein n=1 Tax=Pinctada imbricata TaxID=66713 RepID=A0AA88Y6C9_PINIB|nr:hypothetical protein FSP39_004452 [Pinctada imbricata]